jgi:hypothetical protein
MPARTFEEWLGDLEELVQEELEMELLDVEEYEELDAKSYWEDGFSPRIYMDECILADTEEDLTDVIEKV